MTSLSPLDFERISDETVKENISRPSLSYWADAWIRLKANKRALFSLYLILSLLVFTILGPLIWNVDPAFQDLDQISQPPGSDRLALIVNDYEPWSGQSDSTGSGLRLAESANTMVVRLVWDALPNSTGHRVYRNIFPVGAERAFGIPLAEYFDNTTLSFEDRLDLKPQRYYYSVVSLYENGELGEEYESIAVDPQRVITISEAQTKDLVALDAELKIGDAINLNLHPLGTDYLGRDMLARLMEGARVSLFIGIGAPSLFIIFGIIYGSFAGFVGGKVDQILMRFADFVVALPFYCL